jgi:hypothetical protein
MGPRKLVAALLGLGFNHLLHASLRSSGPATAAKCFCHPHRPLV